MSTMTVSIRNVHTESLQGPGCTSQNHICPHLYAHSVSDTVVALQCPIHVKVIPLKWFYDITHILNVSDVELSRVLVEF